MVMIYYRINEIKQETVDSKQATEVLNELIANYDLFLITQGWTFEKINELPIQFK